MNKDTFQNKMLGCLYGQAIGDALGLGSEFMSKNDVAKNYPKGLTNYDQIVQDAHRCRWAKGAWTDDTDMMLCILEGYKDGKFSLVVLPQTSKIGLIMSLWESVVTLTKFYVWVTM